MWPDGDDVQDGDIHVTIGVDAHADLQVGAAPSPQAPAEPIERGATTTAAMLR
jgi:hypothetical protein